MPENNGVKIDEIKLDLGCGEYKIDGFIGIDKVDFGFNKVLDLEFEELPFDDNSVSYIKAIHFIEHLRDVKFLLNQCHRVLKENGIFEIEVPYGLWQGAYNPDHHQVITATWFGWLRKKDLYKRYGYYPWIIHRVIEKRNNKSELFELKCLMSPNKKIC